MLQLKNLLIGIFACLSFVAQAQDSQINFFKGSWQDALAKAKAEQKPIFVDFYTDWCGPCKMMSKTVFTDKDVADYYNKNFIALKINAEQEEQALVQSVGITAYPSLFYFAADGNVITKNVGALRAKEFKQFGESVLGMMETVKKLPEIKAAYDKNPKDAAATSAYLKALVLSNKMVEAEPIALAYIPTIAEKDLEKPDNWELVSRFVKDFSSREFQYVLNNPKNFLNSYGEEAYGNFVYSAMDFNLAKAVKAKDSTQLEPIKKAFAAFNQQMGSEQPADYYNLLVELFYYKSLGNQARYFDVLQTQTDKYLLKNGNELTRRILEVLQTFNGAKELNKAAEWAKILLKLEDNAVANYTYASILLKQGNKTEAKTYAEKAKSLNQEPQMTQYIEQLLGEINR
jgi:thiol-disulfide isomerase/thioredoxin